MPDLSRDRTPSLPQALDPSHPDWSSGLENPISLHPAVKYPVSELIKELDKRVDEGSITRSIKGDLALYTYSKECQYERNWDSFTTLARGIVIDTVNEEIVALPFPKFFNYGEISKSLPDLPFQVTVKMDGSLGIAYHYEGEWRVNTPGSFDSDQAKWAEEYLKTNYDTSALDPNTTYLFEVIYPENKVVVNYGNWEGMVFLGGFNREDGTELSFAQAQREGVKLGSPVVETVQSDSIADLLEAAKKLPVSEEGWVVRFSNGYRIKIKGEEYLKVHRAIEKVTPLAIWKMIRDKQDLDEFRTTLPEEVHRDFDQIRSILDRQFQERFDRCREFYERIVAEVPPSEDRREYKKQFSAKLLELTTKSQGLYRTVAFALLDGFDMPYIRYHVNRTHRPTRNRLEGYKPSTYMNRFDESQ